MNTTNTPVSEIIKSKEVDEPKKQSREDWRKAKELEEARKAGTAPAAVDEEGKDINPHIPQYISSAPWYFGSKGPTLKHQRPQPEKQKEFSQINDYYSRGEFEGRASKYRKGACENCGALTHKKKDCLERPRKVGAKFTNDDIAPDEKDLPSLKLDYDGKRDRWNGFDPACYHGVIEEYRKVEEAKRQLKEDRLKHDIMSLETTRERDDSEDEVDGDEDKYADNADMPGTKVDSKQRITVRNLRIREDVAKYLRNLDPNSAYYDPKTRSMRDNPYKNSNKTPEELHFAGDNFVRYSGDTQKIAEAQLFAWQAYEKGVDVHLQAEPTKAELLNKEFLSKEDEFRLSMKDSILERYGGEEHLQVPPKELIFAQTEDYVEYSRHGEVIRGGEKPIIRSKYEEHVLINNHTSVWGSFWKDFQWGYKCCHSFIKNSYCTGASGKDIQLMSGSSLLMPATTAGGPPAGNAEGGGGAAEDTKEEETDGRGVSTSSLAAMQKEIVSATEGEVVEKTSDRKRKKKKKEKKRRKRAEKKERAKKASSSSDSEDTDEKTAKERQEKIKKAMEEFDQDQKQETDERKRKYNSMYEIKAPTEEEMEAYFLKRKRDDDPMASFLP
ncbi:hypothetical protein HPB47_018978 [Ixodes persulcatus]|uniref:Uncharacterized protein n=1 Tax=Ixodes persulcatus TaxID=34615 RepID=A0AC60QJC8_IXOPE|nr:hypothetical protein HPB47_018978 [Ixodes persulcatus]